jgi:hypothetical protein
MPTWLKPPLLAPRRTLALLKPVTTPNQNCRVNFIDHLQALERSSESSHI